MPTTSIPSDDLTNKIATLRTKFAGELHVDLLTRTLYATDASAYQETPAAVAFPKNDSDLQTLIKFANQHRIGLIPRTAGTSLAGQVVDPASSSMCLVTGTRSSKSTPTNNGLESSQESFADESEHGLKRSAYFWPRKLRLPIER